jgi:5-carboxymethyl-2-hydroxymuconate isomerase
LPHFIVEYSANLADQVEIPDVLSAIRIAALETGVFPEGGLRVRAFPATDYLVADGHPDNAYLHMTLRMGHGRDEDVKKQAGEAVFATLCDSLSTAFERIPLAISFTIDELHPVLNFKKNNLHTILEKRQAEAAANGE